jgi:hypothetical protein
MNIQIKNGIVWVWRIHGGWYTHLKAFPEAVKKVSKDNYEPDTSHPSVLKYIKENSIL